MPEPADGTTSPVPSLQPKGFLHVEGKNDMFAIGALLEKAGSKQNPKTGPVIIRKENKEDGKQDGTEGVTGVLRAMDVGLPVAAAGGSILGFVLDMDDQFVGRWDAVRGRLSGAGMTDVPDRPPAAGYVAVHPVTGARVGVWLMPDNVERDHGTLEHFLETMIPADDPLIAYARTATDHAKDALKARFPEPHRPKAVMHTWLAWQEVCGLPYGTAITVGHLVPGAALPETFVAWFRGLFGVD